MTLQQIQLKGAVSRNRRSGIPRSTSRSIRGESCPVFSRVTWPRAYSRPQSSCRRRESGRRSPSLTNIAQWYLDRRYPTEGPSGLMYALSELPPLHTAEEVVKVLDSTVASLVKEPERPQPMIPAARPHSMVQSLAPEERPQSMIPAVWNCPNDLWHVRHPLTPLTRISHTPKNNSAAIVPLIDPPPPRYLDTRQGGSAQALLPSAAALLDTKPLPDLPIVRQSSLSLDNRLSSPSAQPATSTSPTLPSPPSFSPHPPSEFSIGLAHLSIAAKPCYPPHRNPRLQSQPILRKKVGSSDIRTRAITLPQLTLTRPTPPPTPTCLKIGRPLSGPGMPRKTLSKDSLKLHIPKYRNNEDTPPSLQPSSPKQEPEPKTEHTGLSPGPATEINCLITAVDVVKDSFEPAQLDPLEENLGHFSCDFPSSCSSSSSSSCLDQHHRHHVSTSAAVPNPLQPYPLPPRPTHLSSSNNPATTTAISNATLTALLAAEDLVNRSAGNGFAFTKYNSQRASAGSSGSSSSSGMRVVGGRHDGRGVSGHTPPHHRVLAGAEDVAEDMSEDTAVSVAVARAVPIPGTAIHDFASFADRSFFHGRLVDVKPSRGQKEKEKEKEKVKVKEEKEKEKEKENELSHLYRIRNRYLDMNPNGYVDDEDDGEVNVEVRAQSDAAVWSKTRRPGHSGTPVDRYRYPERYPGLGLAAGAGAATGRGPEVTGSGAAGPYPGSGPYPYPDRASEGVGSGLFPSRGAKGTGSGSAAGSAAGPETGTATGTGTGTGTATPGQRRAASLTSWEIRRIKGRGMIFW
jgi:hypothetical protein